MSLNKSKALIIDIPAVSKKIAKQEGCIIKIDLMHLQFKSQLVF